jgi:stalled ribosome rescue protein Dom34
LKNLIRCVSNIQALLEINELIKRGFVKRVVHENRVSEETLLLEAFFKEIAKSSDLVT